MLISPTVFATAGHCAADGTRVSVSFDSKLEPGWSLVSGTFEVDPARRADLAVVVLDAPTAVVPAALPAAGAAESLVRKTIVTSVGYGYSGWAADGSFVYDGYRRVADSPVKTVDKLTITVSTKSAGPCFGDSGGPQLAGNTVLSVTSGGSKDCIGKAEGYRLDSSKARKFLGELRLASVTSGRAAPLSSDMEMLLTVLLVLMVPGLLTYLVPERTDETARD